MSLLDRQDQLLRLTEEALDRDAHARAWRRGDEPPQPGDVFAFPETAAHGVQWAIIERSPEDPRRLLAVAADLDPLVGSSDVAVDATVPCGALTLRCQFDLWLDEEDFDPGLRNGSAGDSAVDRARRKRTAIVEGRPVGSALERETDREPEYHDLQEVVRQAQTALLESRRPGKLGEVVPFGRPAPEPAPQPAAASRWTTLGNPYGMAASVLLVVTLGLASGVVWQSGKLEELARERSHAEAELEQRLRGEQRLEETHRQAVSELRREMERAEQQYQQRIADLEERVEDAGEDVPLVDVPFAWLSATEEPRGEVKTLRVSAAANYVVLILVINDPEPYSSYRLEILEGASGAEVFVSELSKTGLTEVSVALPRRLLAAGEYRLRLYGLRGAQATLVEDYGLRVELK